MKLFSKIFTFLKKIFKVKQKYFPVEKETIISCIQHEEKEKFISNIRIDEMADEKELKNIFDTVLNDKEIKNKNKDELMELEKKIKKNIDMMLRNAISQYEEIDRAKYDLKMYKKQVDV